MAPSSSTADLARSITRAASRQTDLTISLLVDRGRVDNAYRAYAYFRWVDDLLDQGGLSEAERRAFLQSQRRLIEGAYRGGASAATHEEQILLDLVASDTRRVSGLAQYIRQMMEVMAFDVDRRGRRVSADELAGYTSHLSLAVTEALYYFIGHGRRSPQPPARYRPVTGAHVAHMLRDLPEDLSLGYVNIPREVLGPRSIVDLQWDDPALVRWVRGQVAFARNCLADGSVSLRDIQNLRCRIAMHAYALRFQDTLNQIESAGFVLRPGLGQARPGEVWVALARSVLVAVAPRSAGLAHKALPPAGSRLA